MNNAKKLVLLTLGLCSIYYTNAQIVGPTPTNTFPSQGLVGIGTTSPAANLDIRSATPDIPIGGPYPTFRPTLNLTNRNGSFRHNIFEINNFRIISGQTVNELYMNVRGDGEVAILKTLRIGATAPTAPYSDYKLSVDGSMIAKRCVIQIDSWADYVFADNYSLPSLNEVESFVNENKHLPGVPSESEIKEKGLDMGEMNKILMQKVEELTLYMIEQNKKIDVLEAKLNKL